MATKLASEVVDEGIDIVRRRKHRATKIWMCSVVLAILFYATFIVSRVQSR